MGRGLVVDKRGTVGFNSGDQLMTEVALYEEDIIQKDMPSYWRLTNHGEYISGSQEKCWQF